MRVIREPRLVVRRIDRLEVVEEQEGVEVVELSSADAPSEMNASAFDDRLRRDDLGHWTRRLAHRTSFAMSRYLFFLDALDRRILHEGLESAHVEGELVTLRDEKIDLGDLLPEGNQDRAAPGDEGDEKPVLLAELLRHLALHDLGLAPERLRKDRAGDSR